MINDIKNEYQKLLEMIREKNEIEKQFNEKIEKFFKSKINEHEEK